MLVKTLSYKHVHRDPFDPPPIKLGNITLERCEPIRQFKPITKQPRPIQPFCWAFAALFISSSKV
jgi:hypothetical protein